MEMPRSVKLFEQLCLGSLLLGILLAALQINEMKLQAAEGVAFAVQFVITALILATVVLLTSRKRSSIAKWILIIFFFAGLVFYIPILANLLRGGVAGLIGFLQTAMQAFGIYLLFTSDSKEWFASKHHNPHGHQSPEKCEAAK